LAAGLCPDPLGELTAFPQNLSRVGPRDKERRRGRGIKTGMYGGRERNRQEWRYRETERGSEN